MEDWIINNHNIFGLDKENSIYFVAIQFELISQLKKTKKNSLENFLKSETNVKQKIIGVTNLSINEVMRDFFNYENFNTSNSDFVSNRYIISILLIKLSEFYTTCDCSLYYSFSKYKESYQKKLNDFISCNLDNDESDFINSEIFNYKKVITELEKPIYDISFFDFTNEPCDFKKWIETSLNKRIDYLKDKKNNIISYNSDIFFSEKSEKLFNFLVKYYTSNNSDNRFLYIFYYLRGKHLNVSQKKFEFFVFKSYKNLRESNKLNRGDELLKLKSLESSFSSDK